MSFDAKSYPVRYIFNKAVFDIPRNQRRYVWKEEQWKDLFEDICFSITQDEPHFMGSLVLKENSKNQGLSYYTIIDGQQRLITITILLLAIMKIFHEKGMENDFAGTVSYLQTSNDKNENKIIVSSDYNYTLGDLTKGILLLGDENIPMEVFVNSHVGKTPRGKLIGEAMLFFYDSLIKDIATFDDVEDRLIKIKDAILDMSVVRIVCSSEEDSYTIFEILNARGQVLADSELLKNYIMRYIQPDARRDEAKSKWEAIETMLGTNLDRFVKHYVTHSIGEIKRNSNPYQTIKKTWKGYNVDDLLDDIHLKAGYYRIFIYPDDEQCTKTEKNIYKFFKSKRFEQFRPVFLSLIHQKELGKLNEKRYEELIEYIYNFFVCYIIIGEEKSNKLQGIVLKYAPLLENCFSDKVLDDFIRDLGTKIPGYSWFLNAFKTVCYSNHFESYHNDKFKKRVQVVLEVIEKHISKREEIGEFTIEHILPDSQKEENAQIGNLIPLEKNLNNECEDHDIKEKLEIYKKSSFKSAIGIAERYQSGNFVPEKRTEYLAGLIYNEILRLD